jgi:hypothetical protein
MHPLDHLAQRIEHRIRLAVKNWALAYQRVANLTGASLGPT